MWTKLYVISGSLAGACGVVLGALTAHGLRTRLDAAAINNLETASLYLLVHGLLLVGIAMLVEWFPVATSLRLAGALVLVGIILFCGGLTGAAISGIRPLAAAAPLGGSCLIAGWLALMVFGFTK